MAWAARRTLAPDGSATSRQALFCQRSVVRIASEKDCALGPSASAARRMPVTSLARGSSRPITPVEATATDAGSRSSASAAVACCAWAVAMPRSPSDTLALPEFTATARRPARSASWETTTGAASRALAVKRAAETDSRSDTISPTSGPSALMPAAKPAARKPSGRAVGSSSVTCPGRSTQRERKNPSGLR